MLGNNWFVVSECLSSDERTWEVAELTFDSYAFLVLSNVLTASMTRQTHANHEPIVKCHWLIPGGP